MNGFYYAKKGGTSYNGVRGYLDRVGYKMTRRGTYEFELYESFVTTVMSLVASMLGCYTFLCF